MSGVATSVSVALLAFVALTVSPGAFAASPELILVNGDVFTADPERPRAQAVAIRGERIVAVGSTAAIEKLGDERTRRIDLHGRVVTPGFNDAHFHFSPSPRGEELRFESNEPTWAETRAAIGEAVQRVRPGTWIFGTVGYGVVLDEQVDRFALDAIAPNHPVLLRAYYGHGYVANTRALPLLEIADDEPDPAGGYYERVPGSARINGRYWEYAQWKTGRALAEAVSDDEATTALHAMADGAVRFGVTSLQVFPSMMPLERFARLAAAASLPVRIRAIAFSPTSVSGRDLSEARALASLEFPGTNVAVGGIKWIVDGTPIERGAWMRADYADRPGWRGRLNFPVADIAAMLDESLTFRQQLLLHCVGDATAAAIFTAMENANGVDWPAKRVRIEHGDGVIDDLIPRARRLGVVIVQNPTHFAFAELLHQRVSMHYEPLRSLLEAGIPIALGSDGPMSPGLNVMFASVHPFDPNEAITREQAIVAYTRGSAFAEFAEHEKGTIAEGQLADVAVLSLDVFAAQAPDLPGMRSVLTIVGGKIVHEEAP